VCAVYRYLEQRRISANGHVQGGGVGNDETDEARLAGERLVNGQGSRAACGIHRNRVRCVARRPEAVDLRRV
jgi:hypothetical protein